jgi:maleylacetoacetate isomerase
MEYLDAKHPQTPLVGGSDEDKAYIRQLSLLVACEIHGFSQPMVWKSYLAEKLGADDGQQKAWLAYWLGRGFDAYEGLLQKYGRAGAFSSGDAPTMADCCLIPQLYSARRVGFDLSPYPAILRIEENCIRLKAFIDASPEHHRDAPSNLEQIHGARSPIVLN